MMRMFKGSTMGGARIAVIAAFSLAALAFSGCKDDDDDPKDAVCGDGIVDEGEACDDGENNSDTEADACRTDCTMARCGDKVKDTGEECDDGPTGSDTCTAECKLVVPAVCGDGKVEGLEQCDDGENNSNTEPNACREDCTLPICGDNVVDDDEAYGEACDDGAENSDTEADACRTDCTLPMCGDGVTDTGEACDDGEGNSDTEADACRTDCTLPMCGDGVIDDGEDCDDGPDGSDTCTDRCTAIVCGDGLVEGLEQCDDGENNSDTEADACRTDCTLPMCGDGVTDTGEECDDGENNSDTDADACRTTCMAASCGDGVVDTGEACDDGPDGSSTCTPTCEALVDTNFRWTQLAILEPDAYIEDVLGCATSSLDALLNPVLAALIGDPDDPETDPAYALSFGQKIPLPTVENFDVQGTLSIPECIMDENSAKVCQEPVDMVSASWTFARSTDAATCFARIPEVANSDGWLDNPELTIDPSLFPTNANDQCVVGSSGDSFSIEIIIPSLVEIIIELYGTQMAFELDEGTNVMSNGMLAGFLPQAAAQANEVLPGLFLADLFNNGTAESCHHDVDLDRGPDANGDIVDGWWMYVGFSGDDQVTYVVP